jgi:hypothetical protein
VWLHILQGLKLRALQVWASAQYAQAYCMLLGATCTLLQLLCAGLGGTASAQCLASLQR